MPHLIVLFIVALVIFGPQKLPELARMLGKATAEFRKMTGDFRYALEEEVRELERQTRIREAEAAAASSQPQPSPTPTQTEPAPVEPEGSVPRITPPPAAASSSADSAATPAGEPQPQPSHDPAAVSPDTASATHEKLSDDNTAV